MKNFLKKLKTLTASFAAALVMILGANLVLPGSFLAPPPPSAHAEAYLPQDTDADAKILHVLNRLGYGPRPGDIERIRKIGLEAYIQGQLNPGRLTENPQLTSKLSQIDSLRMSPVQLFVNYGIKQQVNGQKPTDAQKRQMRQAANGVLLDAVEARMSRSIESERQLQEVMTEFWFNHFNIYGRKGLDTIWVGSFEEQAIRPNSLGRFRDLLGATAHHPAMLWYLDNWQNSKPNPAAAASGKKQQQKMSGLNENYARELMELHTLGVEGGYSQQDVIALAKILTGWGVVRKSGNNAVAGAGGGKAKRQQAMANYQSAMSGNGFQFDQSRHDFSSKQFLGKTIVGSGQAEGEQALDLLARHPSTAKYVCTKLVQHFVSDTPPPALVDRLSQKFLATDGDIREVMNTLIHSPEFWAASNMHAKYKDPYRYVISTVRASGQNTPNVKPLAAVLTQMGMPLYGMLTPNGYKYTQDAWLNPDGMTRRLSFATAYATGNIPTANGKGQALDSQAVANALGNDFSPATIAALKSSSPQMQAALILGSPEFMRY